MAQVRLPIRDWRLFIKLGVHELYCPSAFSLVKLDYPAWRHQQFRSIEIYRTNKIPT
jgi:hypothetical protein